MRNLGNGIYIHGGIENLIGGIQDVPASGSWECKDACNVIAFNSGDGVCIDAGTGNAIVGNATHSNGELGIDLGDNGATLNDPGDEDSGPNKYQNFPVLTDFYYDRETRSTVISGTLHSTSGSSFWLEFFSNTQFDPRFGLQGKTLLQAFREQTDAEGNAHFRFTVPGKFDILTMTATRMDGSEFRDTSEFAPPDIQILAVEGTQAIQNLDHEVELVSDKPTFVLLHVRVLGVREAKDIQARLTGTRGGMSLGTIYPQPQSATIVDVLMRANPGGTRTHYRFVLPPGWRDSGLLTLEAEVNYQHSGFVEATYDNNIGEAGVRFAAEPELHVQFNRAYFGTTTVPRKAAAEAESLLAAMFPAPSVSAQHETLDMRQSLDIRLHLARNPGVSHRASRNAGANEPGRGGSISRSRAKSTRLGTRSAWPRSIA